MVSSYAHLKQYNIASAQKSIRSSDNINICRQEKKGESLLQLAARFGLETVVLELLSAGSEVNYVSNNYPESPLWLAIKNGHQLTAEILYTCGANKEQALFYAKKFESPEFITAIEQLQPRADIMCGILFWEIHFFKSISLKRALLHLFKFHLYTPIARTQESKESISDASGMSQIFIIDALRDDLRSLATLAKYTQCKALIESYASLDIFPETILHESEIKYDNIESYYRVVVKAYNEKNYFTLSQLSSDIFARDLFPWFIQHKQIGLASFWSIGTGQDTYQLALGLTNYPELLKQFIFHCKGSQGLLHSVIGRMVLSNQYFSPNMQKLLKTLARTDLKIANLLLGFLQDRYGSDRVPLINFSLYESSLWVMTPVTDPWLQELLNAYFKILNININGLQMAWEPPLPAVLFSLVLSYLNKEERIAAYIKSEDSPIIQQTLLMLDCSQATDLETKLSMLKTDIDVLQDFIAAMNDLYQNHQYQRTESEKFTRRHALTQLIISPLYIYGMIYVFHTHSESLANGELGKRIIPDLGKTCEAVYDEIGERLYRYRSTCEDYADQCIGLLLEKVGMGFISCCMAMFIPSIIHQALKNWYRRKQSTAAVIFAEDTLKSHPHVQNSTFRLLTALKTPHTPYLSHFSKHNIGKERIGEVDTILPRVREHLHLLEQKQDDLQVEYSHLLRLKGDYIETPIRTSTRDSKRNASSSSKDTIITIENSDLSEPLLTEDNKYSRSISSLKRIN